MTVPKVEAFLGISGLMHNGVSLLIRIERCISLIINQMRVYFQVAKGCDQVIHNENSLQFE